MPEQPGIVYRGTMIHKSQPFTFTTDLGREMDEQILLPRDLDDRSILRQQLRELLLSRATPLVSLYDAAVHMLESQAHPARRCLIAHCVREIGNSLPEYVVGRTAPQTVKYGAAIDPIVHDWIAAGLPLERQAPPAAVVDAGGANAERLGVAVPVNIVDALADLFTLHRQGSSSRREKAEALFQGLNEGREQNTAQLRPSAKAWLETINWFVGSAHHNRAGETNSDDEVDEEFVSQFEQFEQQLNGRFRATLPRVSERTG